VNKKEMKEQADLAFEFIEKFYFEASYLIKEIEGILRREDEKFIIGHPGGYKITVGSSTSLNYPDFWWHKKFSVFFIEEDMTRKQGSNTLTSFKEQKNIKLIYLIMNLFDDDISSPKVAMGIVYDINSKTEDNLKKFETVTSWYLDRFWELAKKNPNFKEGDFEDKYIKFKGKFMKKDLFDINNTEDVKNKLLSPVLKEYRGL
jgi:hypothetical protein